MKEDPDLEFLLAEDCTEGHDRLPIAMLALALAFALAWLFGG